MPPFYEMGVTGTRGFPAFASAGEENVGNGWKANRRRSSLTYHDTRYCADTPVPGVR